MILKMKEIILDKECQPREELDQETVNEYIERMQEGDRFPEIVVFDDGETKWLADGFHRHEAAKLTGFLEIPTEIKQGTKRDAILYSVQANANHGKRRTNADKRKAVMTLLEDPEWSKWSDREIARQCLVGHQLVGKLRKPSGREDQITSGNSQETIPQQTERKVIRNGVEYTQDVTNVGKKKKEKPITESLEVGTEHFDSPTGYLSEPFDDSEDQENEELEEHLDDELEDDPIYDVPVAPQEMKDPKQKQEEQIRRFKNDLYKCGRDLFQYFKLIETIDESEYTEKMKEDVREINDYFMLIYQALKKAKGGESVA